MSKRKKRVAMKKVETKQDPKEVEQVRKWCSLPPLDPAKRLCLRCGGMFQSAHRGNRRCERCEVAIYNGWELV